MECEGDGISLILSQPPQSCVSLVRVSCQGSQCKPHFLPVWKRASRKLPNSTRGIYCLAFEILGQFSESLNHPCALSSSMLSLSKTLIGSFPRICLVFSTEGKQQCLLRAVQSGRWKVLFGIQGLERMGIKYQTSGRLDGSASHEASQNADRVQHLIPHNYSKATLVILFAS